MHRAQVYPRCCFAKAPSLNGRPQHSSKRLKGFIYQYHSVSTLLSVCAVQAFHLFSHNDKTYPLFTTGCSSTSCLTHEGCRGIIAGATVAAPTSGLAGSVAGRNHGSGVDRRQYPPCDGTYNVSVYCTRVTSTALAPSAILVSFGWLPPARFG